MMFNDQDITYFELSAEDQSEKEFEDLFEDDYFISDQSFDFLGKHPYSFSVSKESIMRSNPFLEIHSPPPKA